MEEPNGDRDGQGQEEQQAAAVLQRAFRRSRQDTDGEQEQIDKGDPADSSKENLTAEGRWDGESNVLMQALRC